MTLLPCLTFKEALLAEKHRKGRAIMEKWVQRIPMVFGIVGCVLGTVWGVSTDESEIAAALQAIQQAADPSAAVAAYANGAAVDRNDPKLSEAYVVRMVDLGLP